MNKWISPLKDYEWIQNKDKLAQLCPPKLYDMYYKNDIHIYAYIFCLPCNNGLMSYYLNCTAEAWWLHSDRVSVKREGVKWNSDLRIQEMGRAKRIIYMSGNYLAKDMTQLGSRTLGDMKKRVKAVVKIDSDFNKANKYKISKWPQCSLNE